MSSSASRLEQIPAFERYLLRRINPSSLLLETFDAEDSFVFDFRLNESVFFLAKLFL